MIFANNPVPRPAYAIGRTEIPLTCGEGNISCYGAENEGIYLDGSVRAR